jgi:S1-C subfamily serine protease
VSLGTIPDFGDQGEGVLISGVLPGSPAEGAGMREGDRVVSLDGEKIGNLEDFTIQLKSHEPGDKVRVGFIRDGERMEIEAVLVERK